MYVCYVLINIHKYMIQIKTVLEMTAAGLDAP